MPRLPVRIFAGLAEIFKTDTLTVDLSLPTHASDIRKLLLTEYPQYERELSQALLAVNQTYAADNQLVDEGDEIALIPPVGGGDAAPSCRISDEPFALADAFTQLESVYNGGTVLFCGTVREFTGQRRTLDLTYESYTDMALKQMRDIELEIQAEYPDAILLQWHRVGQLLPGDVAVICGASAPHRSDAFAACRQLIERLKKEVPIWKKEQYADGEALWQANERP